MSEIHILLSRVMEDVGAVKKGDFNSHQKFNFRGIDAVINAVSPALRKHGVIVVPEVISVEHESIEVGQNHTNMGHAQVKVAYRFFAPDGSGVCAIVVAEAMDSGDKATAKAMSVAFRTALLQTLCLPTDEADPDADTYERSPKPYHVPYAGKGIKPDLQLAAQPTRNVDNPVTVVGDQSGDLPDWLLNECFSLGITRVYDNRMKLAGTKRPWFKEVGGDGKGFWPPKGTPEPIFEVVEPEWTTPEEPF